MAFWTNRPRVPLAVQVRVLLVLSYWGNFLDGVLTAHNLTRGDAEMNLFMRFLWNLGPIIYASGKFFLFWTGMVTLGYCIPDPGGRRWAYGVVTLLFLAVNTWHLWIHQ